MAAPNAFNLSFQEEVPDHVLRSDSDDEFSTDENDSEHQEERKGSSSEYSEEDEESGKGKSLAAEERRNGNPGWADAMTKVLKSNKPKGEKSVVLARAKKLSDVKKLQPKPDTGFEIEGKTEEEEKKPSVDSLTSSQKSNPKKRKKRSYNRAGRVKPFALERQRERTLAKIATKGVVQLFNVVRNHQKQVNQKLNEAGLERKKEKVLKSVSKKDFLDMLMGPTAVKTKREDDSEMIESKSENGKSAPTWHVLREDFMMGATFKDWDKKDPTEQTSNNKVKKRKAK